MTSRHCALFDGDACQGILTCQVQGAAVAGVTHHKGAVGDVATHVGGIFHLFSVHQLLAVKHCHIACLGIQVDGVHPLDRTQAIFRAKHQCGRGCQVA